MAYSSQSYSSYEPSAPPLPESAGSGHPHASPANNYGRTNYGSVSSHGYASPPLPESAGSGHQHAYPANNYGRTNYGSVSSHGYASFPPGTHPDVIRSFQMVDRDGSGFIDETELQQALSSGYQRFSPGTIRLLIFLFKNSDSLTIGPKEFAAVWSCLGQWRGIFERSDRDRSGKIDGLELRDALYSLGYALPASVLQVLISRYDDGSGRRVELNFDSFVECGMIVKGLSEKFKEKDRRYTGSATFTYDAFMSTIIPFLVT